MSEPQRDRVTPDESHVIISSPEYLNVNSDKRFGIVHACRADRLKVGDIIIYDAAFDGAPNSRWMRFMRVTSFRLSNNGTPIIEAVIATVEDTDPHVFKFIPDAYEVVLVVRNTVGTEGVIVGTSQADARHPFLESPNNRPT